MKFELGVLAAPAWAESAGEPARQELDCFARVGSSSKLSASLCFRRVRSRWVEEVLGKHEFRRVDCLELNGRRLAAGEELAEAQLEFPADLACREWSWRCVLPARREIERVRIGGETCARVVREELRLEIGVRIAFAPVPESRERRIRVRIENLTGSELFADRAEALRAALIDAQLALALPGGELVSRCTRAAGAARGR